MNRIELALDFFNRGYNCCQSVLAPCCDLFSLPLEQALHLSAGFGAGMGGQRGKCGAVTGMYMVIGLSKGGYVPSIPASKKELYDLIRRVDCAFEQEFGTTVCSDLLKNAQCYAEQDPSPRTTEYYKKRPCAVFVEKALEILQEYDII